MDEVLNSFKTVFNSEDAQNQKKENEFENLYKNRGKFSNQEERRKDILTIQKGNRNDNLDYFRGILELVSAADNNHIFKGQKVFYRPNIYVAGFNKAASYKNVLMMSEWLIEKPEDFNENWYVVPCPKGVRVLVVSNKGITKFFSKHGRFMMECFTALPGGNRSDFNERRSGFCVLDGFLVEQNNTLYVLDLLAWNSQPMTDGETEFRQFWLKTQLQEHAEVHKICENNKIMFQLLPMVSCATETLNEFMMKYPQFETNFPILDGLLFYHKLAHYVAGETPLVGWLYPFMVKEVLGSYIEVNESYEAERPKDYTSQADFIQKFSIQLKQSNRSKRISTANAMETEICVEEAPKLKNEDDKIHD